MRAHRVWLTRAAAAACVAAGIPAGLASPAGAATPAAAAGSCASLAVGAQGGAVKTIQRAVGTTPDGEFGPATRAAVRSWQKAHSVPVTGVIDTATWSALPAAVANRACGRQVTGSGVAVACPVLSTGSQGVAVVVLQEALDLPADGRFGEATASALRAVQRSAELAVTGVTNAHTWRALHHWGTPACTTKHSLGLAQSKDAKAQARIRAEAQELAAKLVRRPGTTKNRVALQAMAFAKKQLGKPYVYGGSGPKGYDCSGLQMTAYRHAGLTLPRVAAAQYADGGTQVPLDQAKQGDLVFFATDVAKPATVYHVAMYIGGGDVLEAPHTGDVVKIVPLWTTNLLPIAVRPVGDLTLPLRSGDQGWSVTQLQQALARHGGAVSIDGGFGPATRAAVKDWQRAHELKPSGVVRMTTWLTLG